MQDEFIVLMNLAQDFVDRNDFTSAIDQYEQALTLASEKDDEIYIYKSIGQCYDELNEERKAFKYFYKVFDIDQNYSDGGWQLIYRFAQLSYKYRNFQDSIKYFQIVIPQIPPDQPFFIKSSYILLAYNFSAQKNHNLALKELHKASKIETDSAFQNTEVYCGFAHAYFGLDKIGKAIKFALKTLKEELNDGIEEKMYFILAFSYSMGGFHGNKKNEEYYTDKLRSKFPSGGYLKELERY